MMGHKKLCDIKQGLQALRKENGRDLEAWLDQTLSKSASS